jgi:flagellar basal body-associated protein FliL
MKSKTLWILLALVVIAAALVLLLHTTGLIGNSEPAVSPAEQAETSEKAPEATVKPSPTQTPQCASSTILRVSPEAAATMGLQHAI